MGVVTDYQRTCSCCRRSLLGSRSSTRTRLLFRLSAAHELYDGCVQSVGDEASAILCHRHRPQLQRHCRACNDLAPHSSGGGAHSYVVVYESQRLYWSVDAKTGFALFWSRYTIQLLGYSILLGGFLPHFSVSWPPPSASSRARRKTSSSSSGAALAAGSTLKGAFAASLRSSRSLSICTRLTA